MTTVLISGANRGLGLEFARQYAEHGAKVIAAARDFGRAEALKGDAITCVVMHPGWVKTDKGGASAQVEPADSIAGMRKVIAGLTPKDSGTFRRFNGGEVSW